MPTVLEIEGFRFFFYSGDRQEPPHVHIRKAGIEAISIAVQRPGIIGGAEDPVLLQEASGFGVVVAYPQQWVWRKRWPVTGSCSSAANNK